MEAVASAGLMAAFGSYPPQAAAVGVAGAAAEALAASAEAASVVVEPVEIGNYPSPASWCNSGISTSVKPFLNNLSLKSICTSYSP